MTDSQQTSSPTDTLLRRIGRQRVWVLADWLLIVAALASAAWAVKVASVESATSFQRTVVLDAKKVFNADALWFINETNVIHWSTGTAEGATSLRFSPNSVPADVSVLVHPNSLLEPLVRTIDVLQQAGAQQFRVGMSSNDPFPHDEQTKLP